MFLRFGQILQVKVLECSLRQKHVQKLRRKRVPVDPGVNRRKQAVSELDGKSDFDMSELDEEANFFNVGEAYVEHKREMKDRRKKEQLLIVGRKYFKEKFPNFLTWSDKEQMRYLHRTDPEEWSVEKLSEGFPALPDVVAVSIETYENINFKKCNFQKIIKSNWIKETESKIKNHDKSVEENWNLFKAGKLHLPPHLSEHLKKFTDRKLNFQSFKKPETVHSRNVLNTRNINEFSQIITSYEAIKNSKKPEEGIKAVENLCISSTTEQTLQVVDQKANKSRRHVTFDELKKCNESEIISQEIVNDSKLQITKDDERDNCFSEVIDLKETEANVVKYEKRNSGVKKLQRDYSHLQYPMRINIPKKYLKKGCTYKLNDCYYDERGVFLYRVPGMY